MIALVGASGSGKSTLMNILGLSRSLERRAAISSPGGTRRNSAPINSPRFAARILASCFSATISSPSFPPQANVEVPAVYANVDPIERRNRAAALLERLGLRDRATHRPTNYRAASSSASPSLAP